MGETDGQPKDADWAAAITSIDAGTIQDLARRMAAKRTRVTTAYSLQRGDHGEQTWWMTAVLAAIVGQIGLPGGGFGFGYGSMQGQGNPIDPILRAQSGRRLEPDAQLYSRRPHRRLAAPPR